MAKRPRVGPGLPPPRYVADVARILRAGQRRAGMMPQASRLAPGALRAPWLGGLTPAQAADWIGRQGRLEADGLARLRRAI